MRELQPVQRIGIVGNFADTQIVAEVVRNRFDATGRHRYRTEKVPDRNNAATESTRAAVVAEIVFLRRGL